MAKRPKTNQVAVSPWKLLDNWYYDGSTQTPIPEEVIKSNIVGGQSILYMFMASKYSPFISKVFNNWETFKLDPAEVMMFLKQTIQLSGFQPDFIRRYKSTKTDLFSKLRPRYPALKSDDINLLCDLIEKREDKEVIYETLGMLKTKKKKHPKSKKPDKKLNSALDGFDVD